MPFLSNFIILLIVPFILAFAAILLNYLLANNNPNLEKLTAYECGFSPFGSARMQFHIHFYLVAIFFIIFDLEIVFLIPWAYSFFSLNFLSTIYAFLFLGFLGLGFIYEWITGSLEW